MALSTEQVARYNALYVKGTKLLKGRILLDKAPLIPFVMPWDRWQLRRAIASFKRASEIAPQMWQCQFWIGKAFQRLGEHQAALAAFELARQVEPENPSIAKEAANAALEVGQPGLAVAFLRPAAEHSPQDASLWHNLSLALLLLSHVEEAHQRIELALSLDPDESSWWLAGVISEVRTGWRSAPRSLKELKEGGR